MKGRFQFGRKQVNLEQLLESRNGVYSNATLHLIVTGWLFHLARFHLARFHLMDWQVSSRFHIVLRYNCDDLIILSQNSGGGEGVGEIERKRTTKKSIASLADPFFSNKQTLQWFIVAKFTCWKAAICMPSYWRCPFLQEALFCKQLKHQFPQSWCLEDALATLFY